LIGSLYNDVLSFAFVIMYHKINLILIRFIIFVRRTYDMRRIEAAFRYPSNSVTFHKTEETQEEIKPG